ncbi:MAG: hypothetical protein JNM77_15710 [Pseudonocardia sp.]|nr:hypothetical protein [Pseudonocardia sp.]
MKTRGLDVTLPEHTVDVGPALGEPVRGFLPGDFLLSKAHGRKHDIIRWGQALRMPEADRRHAGYTHAALVVSPRGDLIEAIGEGVQTSSIKQYVIDKEVYQVVRIEASEEARERVVEFATWVLSTKAPYAGLAIASTTVWAFTGSRLLFFMDGSFTCSGLVAAALERMGARFGMNAARVTPAQLAVVFGAPGPPDDSPVATGRPRPWTRRR